MKLFLSRRRLIVVALMVVTALLMAHTARAQSEAFKVSGGGVGPQGLSLPGQPAKSHWAIGEGTHLGRYRGEGTLTTDSAAFNPATGKIEGTFGSASPFTFVAANGDKLVTWYGRTNHGAAQPGTFALTIVGQTPGGDLIVTAAFVAEFVVQPGDSTGKFAGTTGSWIMYAQTEAFVLGTSDPVAYTWEGKGRLNFAHR